MIEKLPISVHILTFNSAHTLRRALESVKNCAEILVIDGGSTDDTMKIAEELEARIIPQWPAEEQGKHIKDFASVRNIGLQHTTQPWILILDSDEYLSKELQEELVETTAPEKEPAAFFIPRRYVLDDGTVIQHATTYPNEHMYFFHRDAITQWIKPVHERVELKSGIQTKHLKGASLAPLGTIEDYKRKNLLYLSIEAKSSREKGWRHWFFNRLLHTLRSRCIALVRLLWIWLIPRRGKRLPLKHELVRFWYGWKLIVITCPRSS